MKDYVKNLKNFKELILALRANLSLLFYPLVALSTFGLNLVLMAHHLVQDQAFKLPLFWQQVGWGIYSLTLFVLVVQLSKFIVPKDVLKVGIGYLIYLVSSYFLLVTRNINNPDFKWEAWSKNGFYETNFLPTLSLIVLLAFLVKYAFRALGLHRKSQRYLPEYESNHFILACLIGSIALHDSQLLGQIRDNLAPFLNAQQFPSFVLLLAILVFMCLLAFVVLANACLNGLRDLKHNRPSVNLVIATSALFALVFNYTLQLGVQEKVDLLGYYLFPGASLFQLIILFLLAVVVYSIINQYFSASILILGLGTVLSIANSIKMAMRNEPLLITDFVWLKELHLVMSFVDKNLFYYLVSLLLLVAALAYLLRKRLVPGKIYSTWQKQLAIVFSVSMVFIGVFYIFQSEKDKNIQEGIPILSKLNNGIHIDYLGFATNARYKSLMYIWVKQLTNPVMEKPHDYSFEAIANLAERYEMEAAQINQEREQSISEQTVIYVLSESLSNPKRVPGVTVSMDVLENINQIKATTTSGIMQSDGYGGGTANMEFQSLTGLPFYNFSPTVSTLYSEVVPKMSVFPSISDAFEGDNRYVLHPSGASNYNRYNIYSNLGFGELVFWEGSKDKFSNIRKQGVSVSDETVYDNILERLNADKSQFFSVITMQNHAPWSVGNPEEVVAQGEGFTEKENDTLTEYSRLLSHTDRSTKQFLERLSEIDKKITVVFYGDHLPGFYPERLFTENPNSQYQTDYFIWSNWKEEKRDYPLLNSSDFTAALLDHTNSKVSPYYALLTRVLEKASISSPADNPEHDQIAHDLMLLQYDITVGRGYIRDYKNFFLLPNEKK
ncbi:LTA synthase family protein [Streptococcus ovuberis]|uniref:LTA synthase family protein n=1 Tax=Streptococcus ovuberis TaxID=1936207 RepID=A0A7X6RZP8_9STRE|nr:LTA synthase family protein [Streptococcus ovuberis]NKZ19368.1 LTA synthase family protein [Streptococcus ovuberis]